LIISYVTLADEKDDETRRSVKARERKRINKQMRIEKKRKREN
jgi:hypothetical protein